MPSDNYRHQTINNFKKLIEQEVIDIIFMIAISIFQFIHIHIGPTRLLKDSASNTQYDLKRGLRRDCAGLDWGNNAKIEEVIATIGNNKDEIKDLQEKIRQLKSNKQCQKQAAAAAKVKTDQ